ncbi:hypothetical protein [Halomonas sp. SpR8]|uniref:hypothetical protein n=1 Tax=Halomonas sp. SpR8 TaxID=3050463 RepID=UPI0027E403A3|nr:hypothetical protein [Halomonas sp. SpR8]MDQ7728289.1 hypothetical protein [Halomonas sp. SpR8]
MLAIKRLAPPIYFIFQRLLNDPMLLTMSGLWGVLWWLQPQSLSEMGWAAQALAGVLLMMLIVARRAVFSIDWLASWGC